jgi:hypothetical protein
MFLLERSSTGNLPGSLVLQRTASCAVSAARASVNPGNDYSGVPYRSSRRPRRAVRRERQGAPGKVRVRWERLVGRPGRRTRARGDARGSGARSGRRRAWISRTSDRGSGPESTSSASRDDSTGKMSVIFWPRFPPSNPIQNSSAPKKPRGAARTPVVDARRVGSNGRRAGTGGPVRAVERSRRVWYSTKTDRGRNLRRFAHAGGDDGSRPPLH